MGDQGLANRGNGARILAIVGPTAVGKTGISIRMARAVAHKTTRPVEIVSVDSRQVYKYLDIGTAKPTNEERSQCTHHFVDELELAESFSAGRFATEAERRIHYILERGAIPLVVGGSTLYLEALVHGLAQVPQTTPATRRRLMVRLQKDGADALFDELSSLDPDAAASMDATKTQRLLRALEVLEDTGRRISEWQRRITPPRYTYDVRVLSRPRAQLYARIEARVDTMLSIGLLDEVRGILAKGLAESTPVLATIGYREPIAFLTGEIDFAEMVRLLKRNTRRYAKRQLTWFRRHTSYRWHDLDAIKTDALVDALVRAYVPSRI